MKVSVIMSVRNGMPFIKDSVKSILSQTYTNWELLIVDDGSNDETLSYLTTNFKEHNKISIIKTNGVGRSRALNIAINKSTGKLLANIDADDIWFPQKLEIQVAFYQKGYNGLLCTKSTVFFHEIPDQNIYIKEKKNIHNVTQKLLYTNPICHSSVMYPRNTIITLNGYNESLKKLVDYDLWIRMYLSKITFYCIMECLVGKRIHENQSFENKKRLAYVLDDYRMRRKFISDAKASKKFKILNFIKMIYGLLPQKLRMRLKKKSTYFR